MSALYRFDAVMTHAVHGFADLLGILEKSGRKYNRLLSRELFDTTNEILERRNSTSCQRSQTQMPSSNCLYEPDEQLLRQYFITLTVHAFKDFLCDRIGIINDC